MNILFVINSFVGGGAERVFLDMLKNINRSKFEIDVLVVDDFGIHCKEMKELVHYQKIIRHVSHPKLIRWFWKAISILKTRYLKWCSPQKLHKKYVKKKYDIEVAYLEGMATKIVAGGTSAFKYAWIHTDVLNNPWAEASYRTKEEERLAYQSMDKVIAVSRSVKEAADKKFQICSEVKYNILDDQRIRQLAKSDTRTLNKDKLAIVSVGTLWQAKGYLRLIKCVKRLLQQGCAVELHLIGDGEDREMLETYIAQQGLKEKVHLLGFQKDPYGLMCQADMYVCSSYAEGFSTSVTEALILGVPVVTTKCAGMHELLGDSEYGLIVENSEEALWQGLHQLVTEDKLRAHYKMVAMKRGKDFQIHTNIDKLEKMFLADYEGEKIRGHR
jgi:Glycosyltransferase